MKVLSKGDEVLDIVKKGVDKGSELLGDSSRIARNFADDVAEETVEKAAKETAKELRRPYLRKSTREPVEKAAARDSAGRAIDPNTRLPIDGKPHLGHKRGEEFWRHQKKRPKRRA